MRAVPNSLHDDVADRLRSRIFEGALHAGAFIDEAALCTEWAISRTPLREALKVLAAEGLVRHEPRRGSFVSEVTEQDLDEIFPVIALLEGRCAFEATRKATAADIAALDTLHDSLQAHAAARRIPDYYAANYSIHEAIITLADNRWLAQVIADLRKILKLARLQQLLGTVGPIGRQGFLPTAAFDFVDVADHAAHNAEHNATNTRDVAFG